MSRPLVLSIVIAFAAGAAAMYLYDQRAAQIRPAAPRPVGPAAAVPAEPAVPAGTPSRPADSEAVMLRQRLAAALKENKQLKDDMAAAMDKSARQADLPATPTRTATLNDTLAKLAAMKKAGLGALTSPESMAQLITDLKAVGPEGTKAVLALLQSGEINDRVLAAQLLGSLGDTAAITPLRDTAIKDADAGVSHMASHSLALMDSPETADALRHVLDESTDKGSQVNAMYGLCKNGDAAGLERALAYMRDAGAEHRANLGVALMLRPDERFIPIAEATIQAFGTSPEVMGYAIDFYKGLGSVAGRTRLQQIATDEHQSAATRARAQAALNG